MTASLVLVPPLVAQLKNGESLIPMDPSFICFDS